MYRMSWPGAHTLGRMGVPLEVKVMVNFDPEAGVFVAVSKDLPGLVVEAQSLDEVVREVRDVLPMLLKEETWKRDRRVAARVSYTDLTTCCA